MTWQVKSIHWIPDVGYVLEIEDFGEDEAAARTYAELLQGRQERVRVERVHEPSLA